MIDLDKIKARYKESGHYGKWLYVDVLLNYIQLLEDEIKELQSIIKYKDKL